MIIMEKQKQRPVIDHVMDVGKGVMLPPGIHIRILAPTRQIGNDETDKPFKPAAPEQSSQLMPSLRREQIPTPE